ncbi:MAG: Asp-tRNA(Asn)/Glu-tRNA(Gln) amidotransferase subunit GatC [Bacilli bacterium]|nr:Asp-tRNA(Asn)/Glu-tRNA(Gln) amidotransferase subunit GatC [Bacilli bacterium]
MEDKLTKEEVLHVAKLARIDITEEEIEKYQVELKQLLNEVEKINEVKGYDDEILIAPWSDNTTLRSDSEGEMLDPKKVIENAPKHSGNYIEVPVVIGESEGA